MSNEKELRPCPFEGCQTYVCKVEQKAGAYPQEETWRASCLRGHFACDFINEASAVDFINRRAPSPSAGLSDVLALVKDEVLCECAHPNGQQVIPCRQTCVRGRLLRLLAQPPESHAVADVPAGAVFDLLAEWRPIGWVDHACVECVPGGDIIIAGFQCAYHKCKQAAVLARASSSGKTGEREGK